MAGTPDVLSGTLAGRYTIERELGRGATSTVYLARDKERGRMVAIKLLKAELAESVGADRFMREIKVNEQLHHPHIVSVLDVGSHGSQTYFVLPFMEGGSLRQVMEREKQLPVEKAIAIARTIADALHYAHKQGLIHRDVKPENILFSAGQACLADFGIARAIERAIDESTTETGLVRGTPAYMSPEQASGSRTYDGRSDVYSLSCVLYEMLAGIAAFVGPTAEVIIAQRFHHQPRNLRVYRPSVPQALEGVIQKALSLTPADRYPDAAAFSAALETAARAPIIEPRTSGPSLGFDSPKKVALTGAVVFASLVIAAIGVQAVRRLLPSKPGLDTTRVVVLPFEAASASGGVASQQQLHSALRAWRGVSVIPLDQTTEAVRRIVSTGEALTATQSRNVASALAAGRYVVGRVQATPTGRSLYAELRDVDRGVLQSTQVELPTDSARVGAAYAALADSLLLRGASDEGRPRLPNESRHLGSSQSFILGLEARNQWQLSRAESLFTQATQLDPANGRAYLWLAQVRDWSGRDSSQWVSAVERSLMQGTNLTTSERTMAEALAALGRSDFDRARERYGRLIAAEPRSFVGWYGLGESHLKDKIVVPDARSPSGWRFRGSYQQAVRAYTRAFEIVPATYQGFQADGYSRLRQLLFTGGNRMQDGATLTVPRRDFLAVPTLAGDTVVLVPQPSALVIPGKIRVRAAPEAIERLRSSFRAIAMRWAASFPTSASAKEALALSLELQGDRAALDTMRAAEHLPTDPLQRLRLAVARVVLQLKFSAPDDLSGLEAAIRSADSLLARASGATDRESALLAPLAAMGGRCRLASELLRRSAVSITQGDIVFTRDLLADVYAVQAYPQSGCTTPASAPSVDQLAARITLVPSAEPRRRTAQYLLLGSLVGARMPADSIWIDQFADVAGYIFAAQREILVGRTADARARLTRMMQSHQSAVVGEVTADAVVPEARFWLQLGDTAQAIASLASVISVTRNASPLPAAAGGAAAYNVGRLGFLSQAFALHAQIAAARDLKAARASARVALTLWSQADTSLQPTIAKLRTIAR